MGKKIDKVEYVLKDENLPASFDGCRIGFLTDLHDNQIGENNQQLIAAIEQDHFDYIICGGDMLTGKPEVEESHAFYLLERLAGKYPVFYGMGNHEEKVRDFGENCSTTLVEFVRKLKNSGIIVLDNDSVKIKRMDETIQITGLSLDRSYYQKWWNKKSLIKEDIKEMIGQKDKFTILIAHNPLYFKEYVKHYGPELILAGHVHGGLMVIPGIGGFISPDYRLFPKYDYGKFKESHTTMILSRGLGGHTLPIRIHNHPEITCVTLKRACDFR